MAAFKEDADLNSGPVLEVVVLGLPAGHLAMGAG